MDKRLQALITKDVAKRGFNDGGRKVADSIPDEVI
jgi:hypothetical protein